MPLFILDASNVQLDIPIKETFSLSFYGSKRLCKTFKGLCSLFSHNPISSIIMVSKIFFINVLSRIYLSELPLSLNSISNY
jgi:hypothetical protein